MKPADSNKYQVILFDLGGVLLKLRDPVSTFETGMDAAEFHRSWIMSPAVRALESGQIGGEEFARRAVAEMQLPMDWPELLERFNNWPEMIYPEAVALVQRIPARYPCAILSNTNAVHWQSADVPRHFGQKFDRYFLSFESGLLKPDRESFLQVSASYACRPEQILYFDDNPLNIAAAAETGMRSVLAEGPAELEAALLQAGII